MPEKKQAQAIIIGEHEENALENSKSILPCFFSLQVDIPFSGYKNITEQFAVSIAKPIFKTSLVECCCLKNESKGFLKVVYIVHKK